MGIQELEALLDEQKEKIVTLEDRISRLETSLAAISKTGEALKHK